jgi:hypothetical protein
MSTRLFFSLVYPRLPTGRALAFPSSVSPRFDRPRVERCFAKEFVADFLPRAKVE